MSDHISVDMADYVIGVLDGLRELDAVKLFIRGSAPHPIAIDQHPYVEVDFDQEQPLGGYTGLVTTQTYSCDINVFVNTGDVSGGDWLAVQDRVAVIPSQDYAAKLLRIITHELEKEIHKDLGGLVWTDGIVSEAVVQFSLGVRVYGLDNRTENVSNFASVAFTVETQRGPA